MAVGSLRTYGATVDELQAPFGGTVPLAEVEAALKAKKYKIVTFTHVDTSTGERCLTLLFTLRAHGITIAQVCSLTRRLSPRLCATRLQTLW